MDHYYWLHLHVHEPGADPGADADESASLLPRPCRDWIFTVLALMMQAVLPAREGEGAGYEHAHAHASREVENIWVPSRAAVNGGGGDGGRWRFEARRRVFELSARRGEEGRVVRDGGVSVGWNRMWLLERALELKQRWERVEPLPMSLAVELERQLVVLLRQVGVEKVDDEWLDWDFEFPEYSGESVSRDGQGAYVPWTGFPPVQEETASTLSSGQGQAQAMATQVARGGGGGPRGSSGRRPIKYFTVSEVGEMVSDDPSGPNWALLPDGQGRL
jgi:hypothetical protein